MPTAPLRYCQGQGCGNRVQKGYCPTCTPQRDHGVHYGRKWGKARANYLADHPFCVECQKARQTILATEVDHIIPHGGNARLMWDESNWQSLCKPHHSAKTRRENTG